MTNNKSTDHNGADIILTIEPAPKPNELKQETKEKAAQ